MKPLTMIIIGALVLAAVLIVGCNVEQNKWKNAPIAPADYATAGQHTVDIPSPQLDGPLTALDTAAYTDPQGNFLAELSNKMLEKVKEGK